MPKEKMSYYLYEVNVKVLSVEQNDAFDITEFVTELTVFSHFVDMVMPIVKFGFALNNDMYRTMQRESDTMYILLNVKRYKANEGDLQRPGVFYDDFLKDLKIRLFDFPARPAPERPKEENDIGARAGTVPVTVYGFLDRHLNSNKMVYSGCYNECTMADVVMHHVGEVNKGEDEQLIRKLLFDKPDNNRTYGQVVVPPMNFTNILYYLQEVYGVYRCGINLFHDFNRSYILKLDGRGLTAFPKDEPWSYRSVSIEIYSVRSEKVDVMGFYRDKEGKSYLIRAGDNSKVTSNDTSVRELGGEVHKFINAGTDNLNFQTVQTAMLGAKNQNPEVANSTTPKEIIRYNRYDNPFVEEEYKFRQSRELTAVQIIFHGPDLDVFTPNRVYNLLYMEDEYKKRHNGKYRLDSMIYSFNKGGKEKYYSALAGCVFKKLLPEYSE